jgi:hypothetical protein
MYRGEVRPRRQPPRHHIETSAAAHQHHDIDDPFPPLSSKQFPALYIRKPIKNVIVSTACQVVCIEVPLMAHGEDTGAHPNRRVEAMRSRHVTDHHCRVSDRRGDDAQPDIQEHRRLMKSMRRQELTPEQQQVASDIFTASWHSGRLTRPRRVASDGMKRCDNDVLPTELSSGSQRSHHRHLAARAGGACRRRVEVHGPRLNRCQ